MALGADEQAATERLIPVRMLNEFAYCPRLFYLEWVQGEFIDNQFTVEGRGVHRRVDGNAPALPRPEEHAEFTVRSVSLSSEALGLSAKIDLVKGDGDLVRPVDFKRGRLPLVPEGAYEPERVQLCAYGLLLREHGYRCESGLLWFSEARRTVEIVFDDALVSRTQELLEQAKRVSGSGVIPEPLRGSPKCGGCSLNSICLPDEIHALKESEPKAAPRQILVPRENARPLTVQEQGAFVGLDGECLVVRSRDKKKLDSVGFPKLSQVVLVGNVQISSQAVRELFEREIPVVFMSYGGRVAGMCDGFSHNNIEVRRAQFRLADDPVASLKLARKFVRAKILNSRTMLRRNSRLISASVLRELQQSADAALAASSADELLGVEGNAGSIYFRHFAGMLKPADEASLAFDFTVRTRRPPKDPINAMLSLGYSLLAKDMALAARAAGLEPLLGFYHRPRHGRPALALDLMEEFRPIIADSVVLSCVNNGVVKAEDFVQSGVGVGMTSQGRREFIAAYERRMTEEVTHPVFGYQASYRRILAVQSRLLARHLLGEVAEFPNFRTR